jgi:hypothetical protein
LGVIVLSGESPDSAVERFLAAKHVLLVVDNFEHLLGAAPSVGALLGACPALTMLATSREPLALQAEERYPVSPLALPETRTPAAPDALAEVHAIALFCERARGHDPMRNGLWCGSGSRNGAAWGCVAPARGGADDWWNRRKGSLSCRWPLSTVLSSTTKCVAWARRCC